MALSPDGQTLVYVATRDGVRQFYQRPLDQFDSVPVPGTENGRSPFFSPDGESIVFEVEGALRRIALAGGPAATVYDGALPVSDASWGTNDTIVFGTSGDGQPLMGVPATGGLFEPVTTLQDGELDHRQPELLPGGALLFVVATDGEPHRIAVQRSDSSERRFLLEGAAPRYLSSGHLVFTRDNVVWAVPFDLDRLALAGDAVPVLEGVSIGTVGGFAQYSFSRDGSIAYVAGATTLPRQLVWVDRNGEETPVAAEPRVYDAVRLSPDGRRVALAVRDRDLDLWVYDLERDTPTRLTFDPADDSFPVWTPDASRIAFASGREGPSNRFSRIAVAAERFDDPQAALGVRVGHGAKPDAVRERAILALLSERSIKKAAAKVGINERTLRRWLTDDAAFKSDYAAARQAAFEAGMSRVQALTVKAIDALEDLLDETQYPAVRLGAARTVVELAVHRQDAATLMTRLDELEREQRRGLAERW